VHVRAASLAVIATRKDRGGSTGPFHTFLSWRQGVVPCGYNVNSERLLQLQAKFIRPEIRKISRMPSSGMLRRVTLVRTYVSEELSASIIRVTRIGELGTTCSVRRLLVTASVVPSSPILVTLMMEAQSSSETSARTRATRRNILEDDILHSHCHENLKPNIALTGWPL
jgi:hypothetical protein